MIDLKANQLPPYRRQPNIVMVVMELLLGAPLFVWGLISLWGYLDGGFDTWRVLVGPTMLILMGATIVTFFPLWYARSRRREARIAWLLENGIKISGIVKNHLYASTGTGRVANKFKLDGPDIATRQPRIYKSEWIYGDTQYAVKSYRNSLVTFDIYVNSENLNEYFVDPSSIPSGPQ